MTDIRKNRYRNSSLLESSKLPPQSIELEEAVLGAIMIEKSALDNVKDLLKPEMFYKDANGLIFQAFLSLDKKKEPIDILTTTEQLKKEEHLEICGGSYFITQLTDRVASGAHIVNHARIIVEKFMAREVIRICGEYMSEAFTDMADPFDMLENIKSDVDHVLNSIEVESVESFSDSVKKEIKEKYKNFTNGVKMTGIPTGNESLDEKINGFEGSCLYTIAAKEGGGKSARAMMFGKHAAELNYRVAIFSLEMSQRDYVRRFIIEQSDTLMYKYRSNDLNRYDWQRIEAAADKLCELPINIFDHSLMTPNKIRKHCKWVKKTYKKLGMIIVDYVQLMRSDEKVGTREQEVASISRELKSIAKEFDVPVIALAQINKDAAKRGGALRPNTSDLRESAALGNDADLVAFIYRPEYYFPYGEHPDECYSKNNISESTYKLTSEFLISKNRNGDPNQKVIEYFYGGYSRFSDRLIFKDEINEPENNDIKPNDIPF